MFAHQLYGGPAPTQPTASPAPSPTADDRAVRTVGERADGDPVVVLIVILAVAVVLGFVSIRVEVG